MSPFLRRRINRKMLVVVFFLLRTANALQASAQATPEDGQTVELTTTDLFNLPDWQHKTVSIEGFVLGMSRAQISQVAVAHDLTLLTTTPKTVGEFGGPCRQDESSCEVNTIHGPWVGLDLFFEASRLTKIKVSVPDDAIPAVKKANVARQFKALTFQFFNRYSDNLRKRLLGDAEGKEKPEIPGAAITHVEYDYPQFSLVVHTTIDKRDRSPMPFDLEVDFLEHK